MYQDDDIQHTTLWCKVCWFHGEPDGYFGLRLTGKHENPCEEVLRLRNEGFRCPKHGPLKPAFVHEEVERPNQERLV